MRRALVFGSLLGLAASGGALAEADTQLWGEVKLTAKWTDRLDLIPANSLRFGEDVSHLDRSSWQFGVNFHALPRLTLTPSYQYITTDALALIGVNPSAFLTDAVRALTPEDAFFFQRGAQILARYHTGTAPLRAIRVEGGINTALDKDGTLVVPVSLDYAIWAERTARCAEEFAAIGKGRDDIKSLALWTDGRLSDRLCAELKKRAIAFRMNALDTANH